MFETNDRNYYLRREREERAAATAAANPTARRIHLEMADHYREQADQAEGKFPRPHDPVR